ncbi:MAG: cytochrome c oxidase subunit II [Chloroflexi bacterium 13_1_40CM_68_21]|nr:MAG: cytochrome c oxidase subunit II [Chloroflexi bacterium 13_1_40CM_68_21]
MGPWPLDPRGPQAEASAFVYWILFACAIPVLAIVCGSLIYSGIKFRERPGHAAQQFHGHNLLELIWTVVPTVMVISFTGLSWNRLNAINDVDTGVAMTVKVEGRQWSWAFTYPDQPMFKLQDGSTLVAGEQLDIPVGAKVKIELTSKDVIHSFWVPNLGGKKDAVPGHTTSLWLQADGPGTYKGQCFEFCGDGHADMLITIVAHPQTEYATWAKAAIDDANRLNDPRTKVGRDTFLASACIGCHTVKGTPAAGKVGPELTHIASKPNIAGVLSPVNQENLTKWVSDAPSIKPGTLMPRFKGVLTDQQINDIVQWLLTLK